MDARTSALVFLLIACNEGPGSRGTGASAEGPVGAAEGRLGSRPSDGLEVPGRSDGEGFIEEGHGRFVGVGLSPMRLVGPGAEALSRVNRLALDEALVHVIAAEVEVLPSLGARVPASEREGIAVIRGQVLGDRELRAMQMALAKTRGVRVVTELRLAHPLAGSRLGLLHVGSRYVRELRGEVPLSSIVKRADGQTVATDGVGRIEPGRYELADGTFARVHAGHWTEVNPEGPAILFEGRRYRLGHGVERVSGPGDEGALALGHGVPRAESGALERAVARLVVGADFAATSVEGHARLVRSGRPVHFLIDFDGTIHQTLDLARVAPGMPVDEVHIALNGLFEAGVGGYPERHERRGEMLMHEREGPEFATLGGNFAAVYGYTLAQRRALGALMRRLVELFPRLGAGFVWSDDERHPFVLAERVEGARDGILMASQLDPRRLDPGPLFPVRELAEALAAHDEPEPSSSEVTGIAEAGAILARLFEGEAPREEVLWSDRRAALIRLRALGCSGHFASGFHVPWEDRRELFDLELGAMLAETRAKLGPVQAGGRAILRLWRATTGELRAGPREGFAGGFERVAGTLDDDSEWFAWQVGDSKRPDEAVRGHGLVRTGGQWCLIVRPWAGLEAAAGLD